MHRPRRAALGAAVVSVLVVGCQLIAGIDAIHVTGEPGGGADGSSDDGLLDARAGDGSQDGAGDGAETGASAPSCVGLATTCGGDKDCCASRLVVGGPFNRNNNASFPATVSDFKLDVYEVTNGRFRAFVSSGKGTQGDPPVAGEGAHPKIASSGWDSSFNASLPVSTLALKASLKCNSGIAPWDDAPTVLDAHPVLCVTWFQAFAFCTWDGGRLPTETELNYAAAGGNEQRDYPWGAGIDATKAAYGCLGDGSDGGVCSPADLLAVGSRSPQGDGKWGHADLAGNVTEWALDWYWTPYHIASCNDCADLQLTASAQRVIVGGGASDPASLLLSSQRYGGQVPGGRSGSGGFRCARDSTP